MMGGGCGDKMEKWIVNGSNEMNMFDYEIRRLKNEKRKDDEWVFDKRKESYEKNYEIVLKNDENMEGRKLRKGNFNKELVDDGCVFEERKGWERKGWL
jgi:sarcosine dehydrogenase